MSVRYLRISVLGKRKIRELRTGRDETKFDTHVLLQFLNGEDTRTCLQPLTEGEERGRGWKLHKADIRIGAVYGLLKGSYEPCTIS